MKTWKAIGILAIALAGLFLLLRPLPASAQSYKRYYTELNIFRLQ